MKYNYNESLVKLLLINCCSVFLLSDQIVSKASAFTITPQQSIKYGQPTTHHHPIFHNYFTTTALMESTSENDTQEKIIEPTQEELELTLDSIPNEYIPLFTQASKTTIPVQQNTEKNAHDPFRYEWGSWVDANELKLLMDYVDEVRSAPGAFDLLYDSIDSTDGRKTTKKTRTYSISGGKNWDCLLHVLPQDTQYEHSWPTGSWIVLKALTGVAEVAMLREDRDGGYKKAITKDLRGGSDGTSVVGGGIALGGEDCIKYVGGPMRSYMGKSGKSLLLEMVVRPPISNMNEGDIVAEEMKDITKIITIEELPEEEAEEDQMEEKEEENISAQQQAQSLGSKLGMNFEQVGGLDTQLDSIARRVLASRANPEIARKLGISHVRGILLSGPPGCGKTLLARELSRLLGAREPQIVNGPEILDKFIGEAEKRVRDLFAPAEREYAQVGDDSALHIIILDEMDAIARKRGSVSSDTTGVRDSVVNQLLAKMDGVKQANNVLVVGLTNRPELLDPALLRPGRLEVQLRVELPDLEGRRDILRIHTRQMKDAGGLSQLAIDLLEDLSEDGFSARTEHFSGAELAGLIRSAASFALARSVTVIDNENDGADLDDGAGNIVVADLEQALQEVRPALGKQDEVLKMRFPMGISACSSSMERIMRDLKRFMAPMPMKAPRLHSMLLVGGGINGGSGVTALAAWAAAQASSDNSADFVRFVTALDLLADGGGRGTEARASALVEKFSEAREMSNSILVLDDIDQLCAGTGPGGYDTTMISTLRALLRTPPESSSTAKAGGQSISKNAAGKTIHILATTSRSDAACVILHELFEETIVVPLLSEEKEVLKLLEDSGIVTDIRPMAKMIIEQLGTVGSKTALRLVERAVSSSNIRKLQVLALEEILDDLAGDEAMASKMCQVL